jgi:hypothetical protein
VLALGRPVPSSLIKGIRIYKEGRRLGIEERGKGGNANWKMKIAKCKFESG